MLYNIQGTKTIKPITIGSNTVQQNDINWSKRILGKEALAQIKTKTKKQDLIPIITLPNKPSINGSNRVSLKLLSL